MSPTIARKLVSTTLTQCNNDSDDAGRWRQCMMSSPSMGVFLQVSPTQAPLSISLFTQNPGATSLIATWQPNDEQQQCNGNPGWWWCKQWCQRNDPQDNNDPTMHQWQQQPTIGEPAQSFTHPHSLTHTQCRCHIANSNLATKWWMTMMLSFIVVIYSMTWRWAAPSQLHPDSPT